MKTDLRRSLHFDDLSLQPLRIPDGWTVEQNQFFELTPGTEVHLEGVLGGDPWELFVEDMLQITHAKHDYTLDLGWYPESDPRGRFRVVLIHREDWEKPHMKFESRDKQAVIAAIETALEDGSVAA